MKKKHWMLFSSSLLTVAVLALMFYMGYLRFNYPSFQEYPVQGIDISHHQGDIDWDAVSKEKIKFVFIKATEGGDFKDPKFHSNWIKAQDRGLKVSAYHFYRPCKNGIDQADNFIATVPVVDNSLPMIIDLEVMTNCTPHKSDDQFIKEIQDYIDKIKAHYGKTPIIYSTENFYNKYIKNRFLDCPIWIRDIYKKPTLPDNRNWLFWQFSNRGRIKGINTYVDLNVFNGNQDDFNKLTKSSLVRH